MTPGSVGPFSRPFPLHRLSAGPAEARVEAAPAERAALAADLDLPAVHRIEGEFRISGTPERVRVTGRVTAAVEQTCGVTLDPFPVEIDQEVEVEFATPDPRRRGSGPDEVELSAAADEPDELLGDSIDLGAVAAEFLALGLDPYPRKPGAAFEPPADGAADSPFAKLASLRERTDKG